MSKGSTKELNADRLYDNALASIKLGIEDFKLSKLDESDGGNPTRALSSVRNLYAGLLLLFKYKIATLVNSPADSYQLIFNPPAKILPSPDGIGGISWKPHGKFKQTTIDVAQIKERFESFGIEIDWKKIESIQQCRNHLEHLHPEHTYGEVAGFVADLFPILENFIQNELHKSPQTVLGSAWETMLQHSEFFLSKVMECVSSWEDAGVPNGMREFISECTCNECSSRLLRACEENLEAGETVSRDEEVFSCVCINCGNKELIVPILLEAFEREYFYWPADGDDVTHESCFSCSHDTFVIAEQSCRWCGAGLDYEQCWICGEGLGQDDQDNDGLCGYHNHQMSKH